MKDNKSSNTYIRFSGAAFQMMAVLGIFIWLGRKGDDYFHLQKPWLTVIMSLIGVVAAMYQIIRELKNLSK